MLGGILGWNDPYLKSCFPDSKLHKSAKLLLLRNKNLRFIEKQWYPPSFLHEQRVKGYHCDSECISVNWEVFEIP